ncbi:MAG: hypothetical protein Q8K93_02415 [Reyranella sp.]|uniref:hypothetical protein n=1 Tax=Reyranella sp. TaxID=1929291 RepID=UPI00272F5C66|nr:hypothetical protein [Reyranella sp.]MDP1961035.1 hypothetical protein [Reyranella sp.]MDP2372148.1 hypothetical protein [Reyranella sp.]
MQKGSRDEQERTLILGAIAQLMTNISLTLARTQNAQEQALLQAQQAALQQSQLELQASLGHITSDRRIG